MSAELDVAITRAPAARASCNAKTDTPPVPCTEDGIARPERRGLEERVPRGHAGARQRRCLLERKPRRDLDPRALGEHHVLGQHAIERNPPPGLRVMSLGKPTARPRWKECGSNAVADLDTRDACADGDDLAGAVRHGHDPLRGASSRRQHGEVTVVSETAWMRTTTSSSSGPAGPVDLHPERVETLLGLKLVRAHGLPLRRIVSRAFRQHRPNRRRQPQHRCVRLDGETVLEAPDRGQHCLRKAPLEGSREVDVQAARQPSQPSLDYRRRDEEVRPLERIAKRGADLELDFSNDAFRVDRQPATRSIEQHVVVVEITVQQLSLTLRRLERQEAAVGFRDEARGNPVVVARDVAAEGCRPSPHGRATRWRRVT